MSARASISASPDPAMPEKYIFIMYLWGDYSKVWLKFSFVTLNHCGDEGRFWGRLKMNSRLLGFIVWSAVFAINMAEFNATKWSAFGGC